MPVQPTYPGVYIEEIPSGVRTITGVATSITAFVGTTRRGPVNNATPLFSFSDYERSFGGLDPDSDISYAVNQFFLNGGSQAYVVRLAKNAKRAYLTLGDKDNNPVLYIWALDEGTTGNDIRVLIDQKNVLDPANFNITFAYTPLDDPTDARTETFKNLSLDSQNPRYVVDLIHNFSTLVDVSQDPEVLFTNVPNADPALSSPGPGSAVASASSMTALIPVGSSPVTGMGPTAGLFTSSFFSPNDLAPLPNDASKNFKIGLDGDSATTHTVAFDPTTPFAGNDLASRLQAIATIIQTQVQGFDTTDAYKKFACAVDASKTKLILTSGTTGAASQVNVAPGEADIAEVLHLLDGTSTAGTAASGSGSSRTPATSGSLTSSAFAGSDLPPLPYGSANNFTIGLDNDSATTCTVTFDTPDPFTKRDLASRLQAVAGIIQGQVQKCKPALPAYSNFTCTADLSNMQLILTSGTTGATSQVNVAAGGSTDIAKALHLLDGTPTAGTGGRLPQLLKVTGGGLRGGNINPDDLAPLPNANSNSFTIGLDADSASKHTVTFDATKPFAGNDLLSRLISIADLIQTQVRKLDTSDAYTRFTCKVDAPNKKLILTSGTTGATSQVNVAAGGSTDIAKALHLLDGTLTPGTATTSGSLTSSPFLSGFKIGLDGDRPALVTFDDTPLAGSTLKDQLTNAAQRIQQKVRKLNPSSPAYRGFTSTVAVDPQDSSTWLVFTSGTTDPKSSSVVVAPGNPPNPGDPPVNDLATRLHLLLTGPNPAKNRPAFIPSLQGGAGDQFGPDDPDYTSIYLGADDPLQMSGIFALEKIDLFNLLCLPGVQDGGILASALEYCKQRRAVLLVDSPPNLKPTDILARVTAANSVLPKADLGTYAAIYYPWVQLPDTLKGGRLRSFPPSPIIAGLCARTDSTRGVWKAPAGIDANLVGAQGLDYVMTDSENGTLNPHGINCLRAFPIYGIVCWGARTVSGDDQIASDYKYLPVRRFALFIEESLYRGLKWVVFEPNDEPLWAQIRLNVGAFMHNLFRQGAFQGKTPQDAYLVKCDSETTTQNDIDLGIVNILVAFAPLKPAEFVILQIKQLAGQIQV